MFAINFAFFSLMPFNATATWKKYHFSCNAMAYIEWLEYFYVIFVCYSLSYCFDRWTFRNGIFVMFDSKNEWKITILIDLIVSTSSAHIMECGKQTLWKLTIILIGFYVSLNIQLITAPFFTIYEQSNTESFNTIKINFA